MAMSETDVLKIHGQDIIEWKTVAYWLIYIFFFVPFLVVWYFRNFEIFDHLCLPILVRHLGKYVSTYLYKLLDDAYILFQLERN